MLIDAKVLLDYVSYTQEERKSFWKALEDYCDANGIAKEFYCPYVPLQIYNGTTGEGANILFKTRYGVLD